MAAKTLIFSFDGTGNEPRDAGGFASDESVSNVLKLHVLLGGGVGDEGETTTAGGDLQRSFYYNGVGTRENGMSIPLLGRLVSGVSSAVNMMLAPKWGDVGRILAEAFADFDSCHEPGDRLVVFGFSRGAALARIFAAQALAQRDECEVAFLGVFDTVAAMDGIRGRGEHTSSDVVLENGTLHPRIRKAVHIVALDENRIPFAPTLINQDEQAPERILEIWFPGVHSDVGGGYWLDGLSDLALEFMVKRCRRAMGDDIALRREAIADAIDRQPSPLLVEDDFEIHPRADSVIHRHDSLAGAAAGLEPRSVRVNVNDRRSGLPPVVHPSVKERFHAVVDYRPAALRGVKFVLLEDDEGDGVSEIVDGIAGLRRHGRGGA